MVTTLVTLLSMVTNCLHKQLIVGSEVKSCLTLMCSSQKLIKEDNSGMFDLLGKKIAS